MKNRRERRDNHESTPVKYGESFHRAGEKGKTRILARTLRHAPFESLRVCDRTGFTDSTVRPNCKEQSSADYGDYAD